MLVVLVSLIVVIVSQCIHISNHHAVRFIFNFYLSIIPQYVGGVIKNKINVS